MEEESQKCEKLDQWSFKTWFCCTWIGFLFCEFAAMLEYFGGCMKLCVCLNDHLKYGPFLALFVWYKKADMFLWLLSLLKQGVWWSVTLAFRAKWTSMEEGWNLSFEVSVKHSASCSTSQNCCWGLETLQAVSSCSCWGWHEPNECLEVNADYAFAS